MAREDLLGDTLGQIASSGTIRQIKRDLLEPAPWQPRRHFDPEALLALGRSIRVEGVRQNLVVRPHPTQTGRYEIVAGERRWRASSPTLAKDLKLSDEDAAVLQGNPPAQLPCLVVPLSDEEARRLSAVENLQREDLDPLDEATYRLFLIQDALGMPGSQVPLSELASRVGKQLHAFRNDPENSREGIERLEELFGQLGTTKWQSYATNQLPLLQLPAELMDAVRAGKMAGRSALLIQRQTDPKLRALLFEKAIEGASYQHLSTLVHEQAGKSWQGTLRDVRAALSTRALQQMEPAQRQKIVKLLEQLQQELQTTSQ